MMPINVGGSNQVGGSKRTSWGVGRRLDYIVIPSVLLCRAFLISLRFVVLARVFLFCGNVGC